MRIEEKYFEKKLRKQLGKKSEVKMVVRNFKSTENSFAKYVFLQY